MQLRHSAAGASAQAQALLGRVVACFGSGGCYATYRKASARGNSVMVMPAGVTPRQAASSFVNPLTVLGMLSTAKAEGHTALVHTAAASQLGQMMVRVCKADGIPLVNIVRRAEQQALLSSLGEVQSFDEGLGYAEVEARHQAAVPRAPATAAFAFANGLECLLEKEVRRVLVALNQSLT